jgi:threonine dehydrogenase-like Zn-dependent dehydrogenase
VPQHEPLAGTHASIDSVRRGGTISLSGVYGGMVDPMPMMDLFDKQIQLRTAEQPRSRRSSTPQTQSQRTEPIAPGAL